MAIPHGGLKAPGATSAIPFKQLERKWNVVITFKRAQGQGRIRKIVGLEKLLAEFGKYVIEVDLAPVSAPRRN